MAPLKRRGDSNLGDTKPSKKQKAEETPRNSIIPRDQEPAFARGGASVLTPLEHKKIARKAKEDVLFEQATGKRLTTGFDSDSDENDAEEGLSGRDESNTPATTTRQKPRSKKEKVKVNKSGSLDQGPKIEGLSYRRMSPGSQVLGQVSKINRYDLAVSLPNNLTGFVPLTSISDAMTERVERLADESSEDGERLMEDEPDIDLNSIFYIGQYLRVCVTSLGSVKDQSSQGKKHIELSVHPRHTNVGIEPSNIAINTMVQAEVSSVEDHGIIMSLGLENKDVKGFISSKELDQSMEATNIAKGAVILCMVTGRSSNGKIVKLSANKQRISNVKKTGYVVESASVDALLPGTAVEVLVSEVTPSGLLGKVFGVLDATSDVIHSGAAASAKPLEKKFPVGSKIKGRVICTFPATENKKIGVSFLDHILSMVPKKVEERPESTLPIETLPVSSVVNDAKVAKVDPNRGLFLDVGVKGVRGFSHISRVADEKVSSLSENSGPYKLGTVHKSRIVGYNYMDALFTVSMEQSVLNLPFLQIEEMRIGQIVTGTVEKLITKDGTVEGVTIKITENISGYVPEVHLADVNLQRPERKYKEGVTVTARVLSIDTEKRRLHLTLKKSLVNSDAAIWESYEDVQVGMQAPGTLVNVKSSGAVVQFYGNIRAFLPASLMSESYIEDAKMHFRRGQVVNVHVMSVDQAEKRMIVSCRENKFGPEQEKAFEHILAGVKVRGTVSEKTNEQLVVELHTSGLKALLPVDHLADGSAQKCLAAAKRIRVGQELQNIVVLSKNEAKRSIHLTSRPTLLKAFSDGAIPKAFEDISVGAKVTGFIRNITLTGVFVQFANDLSGLLLKSHLPDESIRLTDFGLLRQQTIDATVLSVDLGQRRFLLTQKELLEEKKPLIALGQKVDQNTIFTDAEDGLSSSLSDFTLGKVTKAKIVSVKETQLNVQLATGVQGRIDVSEAFESWDEIKDRKRPLTQFKSKQVLSVRILGIHDSRNHRFLPITNIGKAPVFELSAKSSTIEKPELDVLTFDKISKGSTWLCFVNNVSDDCVWVNLSPIVRGVIRAIDLSDDLSLLADLKENFPIGSAIRATVTKIDHENSKLDLSARGSKKEDSMSIEDLTEGMILPARVTKITERSIIVQINDTISGPVFLANLADDFSKADPSSYYKNQIIRVCVLKVDIPNKRILLCTRPSKILSSSLPVVDREILKVSQLKVDNIVRGFIKHVADNGIHVSLGCDVEAYVRISELSDAFIKDWKAEFEIDRLVKGKVIFVDPQSKKVQLSLKQSVIDKAGYRPPLTYTDLYEGQVVTGRVRKVEDFGVFVAIDNSANVSGLSHKSEISDGPAPNVRNLYSEGDLVKAIVLKVDLERRRISLGLRASYFDDVEDLADDSDQLDEPGGVIVGPGSSDGEEPEDDVHLDENASNHSYENEAEGSASDGDDIVVPGTKSQQLTRAVSPLRTGGFDWTGDIFGTKLKDDSESSTDEEAPQKKKRKKPEIKIDRTGELDINGPQSVADFERLLMGQPNSSYLWLNYMAFQIQLSDVNKAREIAERALRTVNNQNRDTAEESFNVWIAYLNLENTYGTEEQVEEVFKRACEYNDPEEVHSRLASIYIQSTKTEKADAILQTMVKKFSQNPKNWLNYATFLFDTLREPIRARELLPRALQALPGDHHVNVTMKFAQLEFRSPSGDAERGRTIFEGLISTFPKRLDLWNVLLDLEMKAGDKDQVRRLFERVISSNLKPKKAKFFFKKWLGYEEKEGNDKSREKVKARASEFVRQHADSESI